TRSAARTTTMSPECWRHGTPTVRNSSGIRCENRTHFLALCSQMIRRILIDHARSRGFAKRGGDAQRVPLDQVPLSAQARGIEVLALDKALETVARIDAGRAASWNYATLVD